MKLPCNCGCWQTTYRLRRTVSIFDNGEKQPCC